MYIMKSAWSDTGNDTEPLFLDEVTIETFDIVFLLEKYYVIVTVSYTNKQYCVVVIAGMW